MHVRFLLASALVLAALAAPAAGLAAANDLLGGPTSTTPSASDPGTSSVLQPAGLSPLQTTADSSNGLTAPASDTLQAPASNSDVLKVLASEADGPSKAVAPAGLDLPPVWLIITGIVVGVVVTAGLIKRSRRQPHESAAPEDTPTPTEP